ncbi:phage major capsid protein, P2 family [Marinimicrobium sp. ARAG 43.8]|uniref:phage major capsid protein, P2 family n=1 Tax=Marinimicrobium sp. ARAG 43.8 TaxID=3418719 RepID=UPI003CF71E8B
MRNETRKVFEQYAHRIAQLNGVSDATKTFSVEPSVQQTLESKIQESSDFLRQINVIGVKELKGEKVGVGVSGPVASRTNTTDSPRKPRDVSALDKNGYECQFTEFDTFIRYASLDAWAKFPDFQSRLRDAIIHRQALDRIMVGFNGTSVATQTNRTTNPLLQDVNKGWLQKYRENASQRVLQEGSEGGVIRVGKGGDYANLDAVVYDAVNELIDPWHRESTELVAICGRKLLSDKYFPLINTDNAPTEKLALDMVVSQKRLGGQQAVRAPYVPDGAILITALSNLSLYWQEGARRRHIKEAPEYNRVENYESSNDDYVVEDYGFGCLIENIELGDFTEAQQG